MPPIAYFVSDIIRDAMIEAGIWAPGEDANSNPDEAQWGLRKLNYLADAWAAQEKFVYGRAFNVYVMQANLTPHTIGPDPYAPNAWTAPTFSTGENARPAKIESAAQIQNPGTEGEVDLPIEIRDRFWWAANQTKRINTNVVTDLYYDPTSPVGSLFFWPIPSVAASVRLGIWQQVSQFDDITDPIGGPGGPGTLPQAYRAALMLTLAESLLPSAKRAAHAELISSAVIARAAIFGNNIKSPRTTSRDSGMPKAGRHGVRGDFNWITGGRPGGRPE